MIRVSIPKFVITTCLATTVMLTVPIELRSAQPPSQPVTLEPPAWQTQADSLKEEGKYEDAIAIYDGVLKKEPKNYDAFCARALAWLELGDTEKSIEDYAAAIKVSPERHEAYTNRAIVYQAIGKFDQALADANKAVSIAPKGLDAIYTLASI